MTMLPEAVRFTIHLSPVTKKNSQQIIIHPKTKRPIIIPSAKYKQYERDASALLSRHKGKSIDYPVNVRATYYMPTRRRVDLTNLHEALHDTLVHVGIIEDDNSSIIVATDGSRVRYDKHNPRTEVVITPVEDEPYQTAMAMEEDW